MQVIGVALFFFGLVFAAWFASSALKPSRLEKPMWMWSLEGLLIGLALAIAAPLLGFFLIWHFG